jgi:tetratricopeptide (TPR) repeat protein
MKRKTAVLIFLFIIMQNISSETLFEKGEALFMENSLSEAVSVLEGALEKEPDNSKILLYLGFANARLENYDKSASYFKDGAKKALAEKDIYYYNAGNIYYLSGKYTLAEDMFTQAITNNGEHTASYLNRANSRLKLDHKKDAVSDYRLFLNLDPANYQKESIEKLIALLEGDISTDKIQKEEMQMRKLEEEERRKALLEDILSSLEDVGKETKNISAESEEIDDYEEELELEE